MKKVWLFLVSSVTGLSDLLNQDVLSPASSDPAESMLLVQSSQKEADVFGEGEDSICTEPSQPASPSYGELLDFMTHVTARLDLAWGGGTGNRKLLCADSTKRFLSSSLKTPALPFKPLLDQGQGLSPKVVTEEGCRGTKGCYKALPSSSEAGLPVVSLG